MSIIQQIRERAAWLVFGLIALSLIGFLLMDAFVGRSRLFGNKSTVIGKINGENIEYAQFESLVQSQEDRYKSQGYQISEAITQNIREGVWKQMVEDALLSGIYKSLGLEVTQREIDDMLVGPNALPQVKQAFTDPQTGVFDPQAAAQRINQMRQIVKSGRKTDKFYEQAKEFFEQYVPQIVNMRLKEKYMALLTNSAYVPKWMLEKNNADNSLIVPASYVMVPYFSIADSTVKVTEDEINQYVGEHKDQYKQTESRSVAYVSFSAAPSASDSAAERQQLNELKKEFAVAKDPQTVLDRVGTETPYSKAYEPKSKILDPSKDSLLTLPKGGLFGPYLNGGEYVVAKMIDQKTLPDSVRARHILVATTDPRTRQPIMEDSVAKKKIDSIKTLIDRGDRFDSVASKLSDDRGSAVKGGDLGYFGQGAMVPEFNDFCFDGKKGDKKIVKTQFGYHYIEIVDQKNFEPAYNIAYLSKKIETSSETDQAASGQAINFAGQSRDQAAFDRNVQKDKLQKLVAPDIQPTAATIPGLGDSRAFVKWLYGASLGDVSEPLPVGDKYVVAIVTEINKEGTMTASKARTIVEPVLRVRKKGELIIKRLGTPASLDAAVAAGGQPIRSVDSLQFASPSIPNLGPEPKVIGYAFDKELAGKPASAPVAGNQGVFVLKVGTISAKANPGADIEQQRIAQEQQSRSMLPYQIVEELRKLASIKDNRSNFF
ncbi:MAG: SurA N-terminal domain-containing protein [Bacteroidota bacterium]|nr:SurA N-terminal domain-containing protein [Bacteroidota bacterium]